MKQDKIKLPTPKVILWTYSENKAGLHPVKLRVTYDSDQYYYPVTHQGQKLFLKPKDFETLMDLNRSVRGDNLAIRDSLTDAIANADRVIDQITAKDKAGERHKPFTWERFETELIGKASRKGFLALFQSHLNELLSDGRYGTYKAYDNAFQAFNHFRGGKRKTFKSDFVMGKELNIIDITPQLLKEFEQFLRKPKSTKGPLKKGAGTNTVAMYMRALKVIYNLVGDVPKDLYPFATKRNERGKHKIKTGAGKKGEALTIKQLQKFIDSDTEPGLPQHEAKLLWLFSFYCQGMNFRDIAHLKYENISKGVIRYLRTKTKDTEMEEEPLEVPLTDAIRAILIELGNSNKKGYVFDFINDSMEGQEKYLAINQKIKLTNKHLKALCEANSLPPITTYWARHTYASLLKEAGESIELIRELLGHSDIRTTETYLKRFDIDRKREANDKITSLLNKRSA